MVSVMVSAIVDDCGICNGNNADQDCNGVCLVKL